MPVIMMSGHATIDTAVEATKIGAMAFLEKPITLQKLLQAVENGLAKLAVRKVAGAQAGVLPSGLDVQGVVSVFAAVVEDTSPKPTQSFLLEKPLRDARDEFEKAYFEFHLHREGGSMTRVAEKTGLERTHLYRKLKQLGVDLSRGKRSA
jgi:DNA-binding NtrC family response regulator